MGVVVVVVLEGAEEGEDDGDGSSAEDSKV